MDQPVVASSSVARQPTAARVDAVLLAGTFCLLYASLGYFFSVDSGANRWLLPAALGVGAVAVLVAIYALRRWRPALVQPRPLQPAAAEIDRQQAILDAAGLGCWEWDITCNATRVDARWAQMLGYTVEEACSTRNFWAERLHPDDADRVLNTLDAHLQGITSYYQAEYRLRSKNGVWRWILAHGQATERDAAGRVLRIAGIHQDITERKWNELAAQENEAQLRGLLDSSLQGYFIHRDRKVVFANQAMADILGYRSPEELMTLSSIDVLIAEHERPRLREYGRARLAGEPVLDSYEFDALRHDGSPIILRYSASVLRWRGEPAIQVTAVNVTEQRDAERRLLEAKRQAEAASQSKSDFLANTSHEIRTPINGVMGISELLLGTELNPRQRRYVKNISHSSEMLLNIVNDILDFSKIEAGKLDIESVALGLHELGEEVIDLFSERAAQKSLRLVFDMADGIPAQLAGDPTRLRQVLTNLIGNAIKFTAEGEVTLRITPADGHPGADQRRVRFAVRDTGIGIDADAKTQVFDAFSQATVGTTRRFGGTGLGLAICKQLVELMGGEIGVDSTAGVGSTFWFELPFGPASANDARRPEPAGAGATTTFTHQRVLLVDDNPISRAVAGDMLQLLGCQVSLAENGLAALQRLENTAADYDMVLMDCQMPEMDGFAATAAIRKREQQTAAARRLPIIALTANAMRGDREHCLAMGMDDYMVKPFKKVDLQTMLSRWLSAPNHPDDDRRPHSNAAA